MFSARTNAESAFREIDTDGSGTLSVDELAEAAAKAKSKQGIRAPRARLQWLMNKYGGEGGELNLEGFKSVIAYLSHGNAVADETVEAWTKVEELQSELASLKGGSSTASRAPSPKHSTSAVVSSPGKLVVPEEEEGGGKHSTSAVVSSPGKLVVPEEEEGGGDMGKWNITKWVRGSGIHLVISAAFQQQMADRGLGSDSAIAVAKAAEALAAAKDAQTSAATELAVEKATSQIAAAEAALKKARSEQADAALAFIRGLNEQSEIDKLLRTEAVLDGLGALLWRQVEMLKSAGAATSDEIQGKFAGAITASFSGLDTFFGGLEGVCGSPNPKLKQAMEAEHTEGGDNQDFTTGSAPAPEVLLSSRRLLNFHCFCA